MTHTSSPIPGISIVVPVGPNEDRYNELVNDLINLPAGCELIFVKCNSTSLIGPNIRSLEESGVLRIIDSKVGRAAQANIGAAAAKYNFLWFLHADSRVSQSTVSAAARAASMNQNSITYFDLRFQADGPAIMKINELGVWLRSRLLSLPFGDQGFLLSKKLFFSLGGFDEMAPYGEDQLFIRKAIANKVKITPSGSTILTSARKYRSSGWLTTTLETLIKTFLLMRYELR